MKTIFMIDRNHQLANMEYLDVMTRRGVIVALFFGPQPHEIVGPKNVNSEITAGQPSRANNKATGSQPVLLRGDDNILAHTMLPSWHVLVGRAVDR
jgi:hypothetical protein